MALIMNFMKNIWFKSGIDFKDFFHAVFLLPEQHQTKMVLLKVVQFYPTAISLEINVSPSGVHAHKCCLCAGGRSGH